MTPTDSNFFLQKKKKKLKINFFSEAIFIGKSPVFFPLLISKSYFVILGQYGQLLIIEKINKPLFNSATFNYNQDCLNVNNP